MPYPNPYFAFVDLFIGEKNFSPIPPEYLIDFSHEKSSIMDTVSTFSFTLFDETAIDVEYYLITSADPFLEVRFRYGYVGGAVSNVYGGIITDYSLNISQAGAVLNIDGMSNSMKSHRVARKREYVDKDIHEIITEIAKMEGWKLGAVEECEPVYDTDIDSTEKVRKIKKRFVQDNIPSDQFIINKLTKYAKSKETGDSGYELSFDDISGIPVVNFCTRSYNYKKPVATYVTFFGREGQEVISFEPQFNGTAMLCTGAGVEAYGVDEETGEFIAYKHDASSNPNARIIGTRTPATSAFGSSIMNFSSGSLEEMRRKSANLWKLSAMQVHSATMTIRGNPRIKSGDSVDVVFMTRKMVPHHTSGNYYVESVTNSIRGGQFQTSLQLIRDAIGLGDTLLKGKDINDLVEQGVIE